MSDVTPAPRRFVSAAETEVEALEGKTHHWYLKDGLGDSESLVFVRARITKGAGHPFHSHPEMDEIIYVLEGEMEQWLEQEKRMLRPGDCIYIPRGVIHGCYNISDAECEFLAVLTPSKISGPFSVDYADQEPWKSLR
ncbi:MAG: Thermophilic glucose-6-phosphate isomerase [Chthoniobacter sp.]|jgi:quercetin dioxygenase-like cupin family protein|nr:Thermophilic glucose-6-phosphate isomerase [Chthoniobacter sp.]